MFIRPLLQHKISTSLTFSPLKRSLFNGKKTVLGIETSCDDTCAAILTEDGQILNHVEASQWNIINEYKGILCHTFTSNTHTVI